MKVTIDLPDALFIAATRRAADERRPLREIVVSGLRAHLQRPRRGSKRVARIAWVTVSGGLPRGTTVADRDAVHNALRRCR